MRIDPVGLDDEMVSTLEDFEAYWRLALERVGAVAQEGPRAPVREGYVESRTATL